MEDEERREVGGREEGRARLRRKAEQGPFEGIVLVRNSRGEWDCGGKHHVNILPISNCLMRNAWKKRG